LKKEIIAKQKIKNLEKVFKMLKIKLISRMFQSKESMINL
jgi:hypothetical protein